MILVLLIPCPFRFLSSQAHLSCQNQMSISYGTFFQRLAIECINKFVPKREKVLNKQNPRITREIIRLRRRLSRLRKRKRDAILIQNINCELKEKIKEAKYRYFNVTLTNFLQTSPEKF
ncbi:unnamed protein product [Ixodes hexagonus]